VLVLEDHGRLSTAVVEGLPREGMAANLAFDAREAVTHATVNRYDVVVVVIWTTQMSPMRS
jgi:DNA-binding response OmpR family regulator